MNNNLLFDFTVNKENNSIAVKREFAAPQNLVWDAWTTAAILDQWWAPKPYRAETKTMDFKEGGYWLYSMVGPQNDRHWSRTDYQKITPISSYAAVTSFCDEEGHIDHDMSGSLWTNNFSEHENVTTVDISIRYRSLEILEKLIKMGFKEGFTMGLANLDEVLLTVQNRAF